MPAAASGGLRQRLLLLSEQAQVLLALRLAIEKLLRYPQQILQVAMKG